MMLEIKLENYVFFGLMVDILTNEMSKTLNTDILKLDNNYKIIFFHQ